MLAPTPRWYAATVLNGFELVLHKRFTDMGYTSAAPTEVIYRRTGKNRRAERREYPMLSGYLLCKANDAERVVIESQREVTGWVCMQGIPSPISDAAVAKFLNQPTRVTAGYLRRALKVGQPIEVADGPLVGYAARLTKIRGARARIALKDGREVELPVASLSAA